MTIEEIVTNEEIQLIFAHANFGRTPHREVLRDTLLKCAAGWHSGGTAKYIVRKLGLVKPKKWKLTKKGKKYLYRAYSTRHDLHV